MVLNHGGGKEQLYDQTLERDGTEILKDFMLQPVGPEALGWFPEPIKNMDDFQKIISSELLQEFQGKLTKDIGIASVAMGGGDILPALEAGTIDAAEWCCPKPDYGVWFPKSS